MPLFKCIYLFSQAMAAVLSVSPKRVLSLLSCNFFPVPRIFFFWYPMQDNYGYSQNQDAMLSTTAITTTKFQYTPLTGKSIHDSLQYHAGNIAPVLSGYCLGTTLPITKGRFTFALCSAVQGAIFLGYGECIGS